MALSRKYSCPLLLYYSHSICNSDLVLNTDNWKTVEKHFSKSCRFKIQGKELLWALGKLYKHELPPEKPRHQQWIQKAIVDCSSIDKEVVGLNKNLPVSPSNMSQNNNRKEINLLVTSWVKFPDRIDMVFLTSF